MRVLRSAGDEEGRGYGAILAGLALAGAFGLLLWAEHRRALRRRTENQGERFARNLAVAGVTAAAVQVAERPVAAPLAKWVEKRRAGLVQRLPLPTWARDAVAVVLMDYTLYWWHVVNHRLTFLYRFHQAHHADLDLDASTALRFHFGEFVLGVPWRAGQIVLIGTSPRALEAWQRLTLLSVMFHHSNLELPIGVERWLSRFVMTPRLHGIHHSIVREEQDSNWSSGLTLWDRLHGTYRANVPQEEITVGVPALRDPRDVTLPKVLAMPFAGDPPPWRLPDGTEPARAPSPAPPGRLLP